MRYEQIDLALTFLEASDEIVLQIPFYQNFRLVREYLVRRLGEPSYYTRDKLVYCNKIIRLELAGNEFAGRGYTGPCFLIERQHDWRIPGVNC